MANHTFEYLMRNKAFTNRHVAIYYLNNLHPLHDRFYLDEKDFIKKVIATGFISASEIDEKVIDYFNKKLKTKPYIMKLAKENFLHQPGSHSFEL
ncbi:MAG: hypothetical protein ACLRFE_01185 [Clostridia bacterium]